MENPLQITKLLSSSFLHANNNFYKFRSRQAVSYLFSINDSYYTNIPSLLLEIQALTKHIARK